MTDESHNKTQEGQPSAPRIVGLDPVIDEFRANRDAQKRYERGRSRREWTTITLLIITAGSTLYSALFLLPEQLNISRDTERRDLRAYLSAVSVDVGTFFPGNRQLHARIRVTDLGKTHALGLDVEGTGVITRYPIAQSHYSLREFVGAYDPKGQSLGPTENYFAYIPVVDEQSNPIIGDTTKVLPRRYTSKNEAIEQRLYVYGTVFYLDAFGGDEAKHYTNFCFNLVSFTTANVGRWETCPVHNDRN
jgi:hypothetical protein